MTLTIPQWWNAYPLPGSICQAGLHPSTASRHKQLGCNSKWPPLHMPSIRSTGGVMHEKALLEHAENVPKW